MKYINTFKTHASYESELSVGGVDFKIPNVSYCNDVKDIHYNPYNLIEFYVGEITGTTPQTVSIYTNSTNHLDVTVSEGNKWYSYVLPKDKGLFKIEGNSIKKVVVKADISFEGISTFPAKDKHIIPSSTVEVSFKGSNTSNVTNMRYMFYSCSGLTSLDLRSFNTSKVTNMVGMFQNCSKLTSLNLSKWDVSNVTDMNIMFFGCSSLKSLDLSGWVINDATSVMDMFYDCDSLTTIRMVGCSQPTIDNIKAQLTEDGIISNVTIVTE